MSEPNPAALRARLAEAAAAPNGELARSQREGYEIVVVKQGREVALYFAAPRGGNGALAYTGIMSRIDVEAPLRLLGGYTQAMLLALLWAPAPARVYAAGLGGGRVPLVLHHALPDVVIDATEIDPIVAELAERFFAIAPDARLRVWIEDGAAFLATRRDEAPYDVMLIDCYSAAATVPDAFASPAFYDLCKARLAPGGVVASNIDTDDPASGAAMAVFAQAFAHTARYDDGVANVLFGSSQPLKVEAARVHGLTRQFSASAPIAALAARLKPLR